MLCELIVEQNIRLAIIVRYRVGPDDTLTKAMKLMFPDSRIAAGKFMTN